MEHIAFLGSLDKKDLLLNMSKILITLNYKVLIVDATLMQRLKYIIPNTGKNNSITYISEYQGIDVAVGFMNMMGIMQYLNTNTLPYDFIFIDTDNIQTMNSFNIKSARKRFLVTSYDQYEVTRMIEIFQYFNQPIDFIKVIVSSDITTQQDEYLDRLLITTPVVINKKVKIQFADSVEDRRATLENQLTRELKLKLYTNTYKDSLQYLTAICTENIVNQNDIRKIIRKM